MMDHRNSELGFDLVVNYDYALRHWKRSLSLQIMKTTILHEKNESETEIATAQFNKGDSLKKQYGPLYFPIIM